MSIVPIIAFVENQLRLYSWKPSFLIIFFISCKMCLILYTVLYCTYTVYTLYSICKFFQFGAHYFSIMSPLYTLSQNEMKIMKRKSIHPME
jgi:hypothetical protein